MVSLMCIWLVGRGITDQDRNILSNQMLILGFFRSAANLLTLGPLPSFSSAKKKKKPDDDDDDGDGIVNEGLPVGPDEESNLNSIVQTRGTILITLRNVPPYTLW
jgi:25S rRNA (uracil2634-N3)-methyltransferase